MTKNDNNYTILRPVNTKFKKSAIFGMITNYSPWRTRLFFDSLACTGYNGTVILLHNNNRKDTLQYILSFSTFFEIILLQINEKLNYFIPNSSFMYYKNKINIKNLSITNFAQVNFLSIQFISGDFRFEVAYSMYMNNFFSENDIVLFCDICDTLFQDDFRKYNFSNGVYLTKKKKKSKKWTSRELNTNLLHHRQMC
ncbi:hypothetical protein M9Y10_023721 [Tritrichomonas musculus]|uniref:Uncharacterized protein n=1 Tax=Tritrichomonas musculus TaxID=1915356 RepID=A0ABR2KXT0_9EUKA